MENYFNYFTEVEECFARQRGAPNLLSALDWALIESWKEAGIPIEAVCAGIQHTFEKFVRRPQRFRKVNGLGYCTQEVLHAAEQASQAAVESGANRATTADDAPPFGEDAILRLLEQGKTALEKAAATARAGGEVRLAEDFTQASGDIRNVAPQGQIADDLQKFERSLAAIEEKLTASLTRGSSVELLTHLREEVERGMAPFRRTMNAAQIESLERQFLKKRLFEHYGLPRLSLFYL
ncbi:MAG: hypothetical protein ACRD1J_09850 [Terriglobia bacterium]